MANDEVRIARALEAIATQQKELVRIMAAVNVNLVEFFKVLKSEISTQKEDLVNDREAAHIRGLTCTNYTQTPIERMTAMEWMDTLRIWWYYIEGAEVILPETKFTHQEFISLMEERGIETKEELRTPQRWMVHLHRWWNYEDPEDKDTTVAMTKKEFFDYLAQNRGYEITDTIPKDAR